MLNVSSRLTAWGFSVSSMFRKSAASRKFFTANTLIPSTTAASAAFSTGTRMALRPAARAASVMGRTPRTRRTAPDRASSPIIQARSSRSGLMSFSAASMPMAIGRSKLGPSFLILAGARLMVTRPCGGVKPELIRAVVTRCSLSLTAVSGRPTISVFGSPCPLLTSISTV